MKRLFFSVSVTVFLMASSVYHKDDTCIAGDCVSGVGTMRYGDGSEYIGQWKEGKRHGKGTEIRHNGGIVTGYYANDRPHGYGTYTFLNNAKYAINWTGDEEQLLGPYAYSLGGQYVGEHDNREHGQGTVMYNDGGTYIWG